MVRAQYYFRQSDGGLLAWDIRRLITLTEGLPIVQVPLAEIAELDQAYWYEHEGDAPTCRSLLAHMQRIDTVDLGFPIVLDREGRVMDGMHRVCRAAREGKASVAAVRFAANPEPDFVGVAPDELPYGDSTGSLSGSQLSPPHA